MEVINKTIRDNDVSDFLKQYDTDFLIDICIDIVEELEKRGLEIFKVSENSLFKSNKQTHEIIYKNTIKYVNFLINHYKEQLNTPIEDTFFNNETNRKGYITSIISYLQVILLELNKDYLSKYLLY